MEFIFDLQRFAAATPLDLATTVSGISSGTLSAGSTKIYMSQVSGALASAKISTSNSSGSIVVLTGKVTTSGTYTAGDFKDIEVKDGSGLTKGIVVANNVSGIKVRGAGLPKTYLAVAGSTAGHFTVTDATVDNGNITAASNLVVTSGAVSIKGNVNAQVLSGSDGKAIYVANTALSGVTVTTSAGTAKITESSNVTSTEVSTTGGVVKINNVDKGGIVTVSTVTSKTTSVVVNTDTFQVDKNSGETLTIYQGAHSYLVKGAVAITTAQAAASSSSNVYVSSNTNETKTSKIRLNDADTSGGISLDVSGGTYTVTGLTSGDVVEIDGTAYTYAAATNTFTTANGNTYVLASTGSDLKGTIAGGTAATDTPDTLNIVQGTDLGKAVTKTAGASANIYGNESTTLYQYESAGKIYTTSTNNTSNGTYLNSVSYDSKTGKYKFDAANSNVGQNLHDFANVGFASVIGGKGADTIQANLGGNNDGFVINSGAGADNVTMAAAALGSDWKITTGAGKDTITLGADLTHIVTGWKIDGGEDDDKITVGTNTIQQSSIVGGAGKDTITNFGTDNTLTGGAGADTFDISAANALANISDYKLGEDLIQVSVDPTTALTSGMFGTDGTITDTLTGKATIKGSGYYAAQLTNADKKKQYVGWVGENATKIDGSNMADSVVLYGTKNEAGDLLLGGAKKDTVYAGAGDSVYGGVGNDSVVVNGAGVYVGVATNSGADSVSGFTAGFDTETADQLYMVNGSVSQVTIANNGSGNIKFSDGSGSVSLQSAASTNTGYAGLLVSGKKVYSIEDNATLTIDDSTELADFYFGTKGETGKGSAVDLSGFTSVLSVDLSNTDAYHNLTSIKGGAGTTSLIGSAGAESLAGGAGVTSLWGGNGGKDTLVSGTASTEFFFASGGGNDVVEGFKNTDGAEDTLNFFGGDFAGVARTGDQEVRVSVSDGSTLTVGTAESGTDTKLTWKSGLASGVAKVGSIAGANSFTYERDVTDYIGGNKQDVLTVNDDAGNVNVWLDGSQGASYSGIDVMNASSSTGKIQLAGDSASQSIVGGQGNTSLWGGVGSATDTLVGGSGVNEFFYLMGNGNDVISGNATDTVNLLDIKLSDLTAANINTSSNQVIFTTKANETVTVSGSVQNFKLGDGSAWVADYTGENGSWSAKN